MKQALFVRVFHKDAMISVKQFTGPQITIGNGGEVSLQIDDASVSPIHAMIEERGEKHFICDLGSSSGTKINGENILDVEIHSGDSIEVGEHRLEFYIGVPKPRAAASATTAPAAKPLPTVPKSVEAKPATPVSVQAAPKPAAVKPTAPASHSSSTAFVSSVPEVHRPSHGTFAPPSINKNADEIIKPSKGTIVQVSVAWGERVISTHHFSKKQVVYVGAQPTNDIVLPVFESTRAKHPLLKIDSAITVFITTDMSGEVTYENGQKKSISQLISENKLQRAGSGYSFTLEQGTVVRIQVTESVSLFVRYANSAPIVAAAPFLFLSSAEFAGIVLSAVMTAIIGVYLMVYTAPPAEEQKTDEPIRMAKFEYNKPKQPAIKPEVEEKPAPKQEKSKDAVKATKAKAAQTSTFEEVGAANKASPNKSKSKEKVLTTPNAGKDKGITKAQTANKTKDSSAASNRKDPTKTGLFSAFGSKGTQDLLNKVYEGSGVVGGLSKNATGSGGQGAAGAGVIPGSGLKAVGAGDNGTSTVGIAGVNTKGRGGGTEGYGSGSIAGRKGSTVIPGGAEESFVGSIDKEAVRRVIQANKNVIRACYEKVLNRQPDLDGKVILEWEIGPGGRVLSASVKSSSLNSPEVEQCLVARLRTWRFPEPPRDSTATVLYPFVFRAQ